MISPDYVQRSMRTPVIVFLMFFGLFSVLTIGFAAYHGYREDTGSEPVNNLVWRSLAEDRP
jgi:hypothetical protein